MRNETPFLSRSKADALLVIDMQKYFINPFRLDNRYLWDFRRLDAHLALENIVREIRYALEQEIPVFFVQAINRNDKHSPLLHIIPELEEFLSHVSFLKKGSYGLLDSRRNPWYNEAKEALKRYHTFFLSGIDLVGCISCTALALRDWGKQIIIPYETGISQRPRHEVLGIYHAYGLLPNMIDLPRISSS